MTAPTEPLKLTLGKALSVLQNRGVRLVPPEEGTDSWGTTRIANWDAPDHEFDTWPEAVSDALGRTVVDADAPVRDYAAELRAALVKVADLVFTIASADEELSFPHYEDSERTRSHLLAHRRAKKAAWEELQELAAEYDGVPALAASEGQP